jgi:hypothetical protein
MKTIKCSNCDVEKEVPDDYDKKTCPVCLLKQKERDMKDKALNEVDKKSAELIRSLELEGKIPTYLQTFSKAKTMRNEEWLMKLKREYNWNDYQEELCNQKRILLDKQAKVYRGTIKERRKALKPYLLADLYEFSHPQKCELFRFKKLGLNIPFSPDIEEHVDDCESCQLWLNEFSVGFRNIDVTGEAYSRVAEEINRGIFAQEEATRARDNLDAQLQASSERQDALRAQSEEHAREVQQSFIENQKALEEKLSKKSTCMYCGAETNGSSVCEECLKEV